ncbi:MAG: lipid II flippase MurJ, partial [Cyanobacteria bacterium P01_A01_bin.105]
VTLALPMVRVVYERGAFDADASRFVTSVLVAYGTGMFVYLGRDVLVRVFYALGDGDTPFRISVVNIFLNALFDFILINWLGAPGLVLATVAVNVFSMVALLVLLSRKLNGLPWLEWGQSVGLIFAASVVAGAAARGARLGLELLVGTEGFLANVVILVGAGLAGLAVFSGGAIALRIPEATLLINRIQQKLRRR